MRRRDFITLSVARQLGRSSARAQQRAMPVIGFLHSHLPDTGGDRLRAFRQGLKETGYVEGENVAVEYHSAGGDPDRLRSLVTHMIRRRVAAMAGNTVAVHAAKSGRLIAVATGKLIATATTGCIILGPSVRDASSLLVGLAELLDDAERRPARRGRSDGLRSAGRRHSRARFSFRRIPSSGRSRDAGGSTAAPLNTRASPKGQALRSHRTKRWRLGGAPMHGVASAWRLRSRDRGRTGGPWMGGDAGRAVRTGQLAPLPATRPGSRDAGTAGDSATIRATTSATTGTRSLPWRSLGLWRELADELRRDLLINTGTVWFSGREDGNEALAEARLTSDQDPVRAA